MAAALNRTFRVPDTLALTSQRWAEASGQKAQQYGHIAVRLLAFATREGFNTTDTRLLIANRALILPSLVATPEEAERPLVDFPVNIDEEESVKLIKHAEAAGISEDERVARALRFRNFIVKQSVLATVNFVHKGFREEIII